MVAKSRNDLKVAILSSTFSPAVGGAESYALMLANGLQRRGHTPVVFTDAIAPLSEQLFGQTASNERTERDSPRHPFPVLRAHRYRALLRGREKVAWEQMYFGLLTDLAEQLGGRELDVVHANSQECAVLGAMLAREKKVPLVCTMHEQAPENEPIGLGRCSLVYGSLGVDAMIAGSQFYLDRAERFAGAGKGKLIYHGINTEVFRPAPKPSEVHARYGFDPSDPLTVCSARISVRKGQLELVEAWARVILEVPRARLVLAGSCNSGSQEYRAEVLHAVKRLGLSQHVALDENLSHADMPQLYQAADVVVQPSRAEGLGLALLEGMACGRAVVGTDISGIREVIVGSESGLLVPPEAPDALAAAVSMLLQEPLLRERLGAEALRRVEGRFSERVMLDQTIQLYRTLLGGAA